MDLAQIRELLKIVAESDVDEVELEEDGVKIVVRKNAATVMVQPAQMFAPYGVGYPPPGYPPPGYPPPGYPPPASNAPPAALPGAVPAPSTTVEEPEAEPPATDGLLVRAPIVGTFYSAAAPGADPFVRVGKLVHPGDVLCIIEAMKLMNEIESEMGGTIRQILVQNAEPVEYDQPLFMLEPA